MSRSSTNNYAIIVNEVVKNVMGRARYQRQHTPLLTTFRPHRSLQTLLLSEHHQVMKQMHTTVSKQSLDSFRRQCLHKYIFMFYYSPSPRNTTHYLRPTKLSNTLITYIRGYYRVLGYNNKKKDIFRRS